MVNNRPFERFIEELIKRYGTAGALADAIGMSLSAFSRGYREEGTLSVENCLRLADVIGENAGEVLRLAGKADVAVVFERLSGVVESGKTISGKELEIATRWSLASKDVRDGVDLILPRLDTPPGAGSNGEKKKTNSQQPNGRQPKEKAKAKKSVRRLLVNPRAAVGTLPTH